MTFQSTNNLYGFPQPTTRVFPAPIIAQRAPTTADIAYPIGQQWVDEVGDDAYILVDVTANTATWNVTATTPGNVDTLSGNTGGAITPSAGNINIVGGPLVTVAGAGSTLTVNPKVNGYPITPYVVGPVGMAGYQTIQAGINAAQAAGGGSVYIIQGTYVENLTLFDQVNLVSVPAISQGINQGVTINGTHTPPTSGHVLINGICLVSTTDVFASAAAGSTHLVTSNCEFAVQNGYLFNLPNWTGILEVYDCNPDTSGAPWSINDGCVNNTGGSEVILYNTGAGNGTNTMVVSGECFFAQATTIGCPVNLVTGANVSSISNQYVGTVSIQNNAVLFSYGDSFVTGATPAITMSSSAASFLENSQIQTSNNPAITGAGAGVLNLSNMSFIGNSTLAGTLTVAYGASLLGPLKSIGTTSINTTGAAVTNLGTGGTGAVNIGNTTGNTAITGGATISTTLGVTGLSTLAALTQVGTANINASGAGVTTIGTGGTGAVNIGNATGNTAITGGATVSTTLGVTGLSTLGAVTAVGTHNINASGAAVTTIGTGGTGIVNIGNTTGNTAVTGSLTASTTLTATLGAITATNGNVVLGTAGNKLISTSVASTTTAGANSFGKVSLSAGAATVNTSAVKTASIILLTNQVLGTVATPMPIAVTARVDSTSFTITSSDGTDTSSIGWMIIN